MKALFDRRVRVVPRVVDGSDAHGNETLVDGTVLEDVRCRRQLESSEEDRSTRDEVTAVYLYWFGPEMAGRISARDVIEDEGERLAVEGRPSEEHGRRGVHHLEVLARIVEG